MRKLTTEQAIEAFKSIHGDTYDYSQVEYTRSTAKVFIVCKKHGMFSQVYSTHASGHGCPKCAGDIKREKNTLPKDEFIKKAKELYGDKYDYSAVNYINSRTKVKIVCSQHGEFMTTPYQHVAKGSGCRSCSLEKAGKSPVMTAESFFSKAREVHGSAYDLSDSVFTSPSKPITVRCMLHGNVEVFPHNFLKGHGCHECGRLRAAKKRTKNREVYLARARKAHGDKYEYPDKLVTTGKVNIRCPEHGVFSQLLSDHLDGHGCPRCHYDNPGTRLSYEEFLKRHGRQGYKFSGYEQYALPFTVTCLEHDNTYVTTPHKFSLSPGGKCPECAQISKPHRAILSMFPEEPVVVNSRSYIPPQELDILYTDHNLAVEVNGLYFHSTAKLRASPSYHQNKFLRCEKKGIRLLQFWDSEIIKKPELVQSIIASKLGLITERVYARDCSLQDISAKEYTEFLETNHLEGRVDSPDRKALFYGGELVAVMGFQKDVLQRFCGKMNLSVVGGFSRLLKSFNKQHVVTYSDNRYSNGAVYAKAGFRNTGSTKVRLYVTDGYEIFNRRRFQRKHLTEYPGYSEEKTAEEILNENGLFYVYGAGTRRWELSSSC